MSKEYLDSIAQYKKNFGISGTKEVSEEYEIGITREYDASQDISLFTRLKPLGNIIVTRDLRNPVFFKNILKNKKNIILHVVVSGYGESPLEPKTPHPRTMYESIANLIRSGFPKSQIVLRIDPVIPSEQGTQVLSMVLEAFATLHIKRCRIKLLHLNKNVISREVWNYLQYFGRMENPYYNQVENKVYSGPSRKHISRVYELLKSFSTQYEFETCTCDEYNDIDPLPLLGCVSFKDLKILGVTDVNLIPNLDKKKKCRCPVNAKEILKIDRKIKNVQCQLHCVHCLHKTSNI